MLAKLHVKSLIAASGLVLATGMSGPANAADPFTLTSATFKDGTLMPKKVANKNPQNPNCVGDNVSLSCRGRVFQTAPRVLRSRWWIRKAVVALAYFIGLPMGSRPT